MFLEASWYLIMLGESSTLIVRIRKYVHFDKDKKADATFYTFLSALPLSNQIIILLMVQFSIFYY